MRCLPILFDMPVCVQMILAVFVIAGTFGTETEFQIRIFVAGSSADRAFVLGDHILPYGCFTHMPAKLLLPRTHLRRAKCTMPVCDKKYKKV